MYEDPDDIGVRKAEQSEEDKEREEQNICFMINKLFKKIDEKYYPLLTSKGKNMPIEKIHEIIGQFATVLKTMLPKFVSSNNKYYALAFEGLWKFLMMIFNTVMDKNIIMIKSDREKELLLTGQKCSRAMSWRNCIGSSMNLMETHLKDVLHLFLKVSSETG